jgi:transcriptional regulator with XRE-family HTH domain
MSKSRRAVLERCKVTQRDLARAGRVHESTVSRWMRGQGDLGVNTFARMFRFLTKKAERRGVALPQLTELL